MKLIAAIVGMSALLVACGGSPASDDAATGDDADPSRTATAPTAPSSTTLPVEDVLALAPDLEAALARLTASEVVEFTTASGYLWHSPGLGSERHVPIDMDRPIARGTTDGATSYLAIDVGAAFATVLGTHHGAMPAGNLSANVSYRVWRVDDIAVFDTTGMEHIVRASGFDDGSLFMPGAWYVESHAVTGPGPTAALGPVTGRYLSDPVGRLDALDPPLPMLQAATTVTATDDRSVLALMTFGDFQAAGGGDVVGAARSVASSQFHRFAVESDVLVDELTAIYAAAPVEVTLGTNGAGDRLAVASSVDLSGTFNQLLDSETITSSVPPDVIFELREDFGASRFVIENVDLFEIGTSPESPPPPTDRHDRTRTWTSFVEGRFGS